MIVALEGILEAITADSAVLKVGPVSLRVYIPGSTLNNIGAVGGQIRLHTHLHVREENIALYGFSTSEELWMFQLLLNVSGIGPRAALALLGAISPEQFVGAVTSENIALLSKVPSIGKKTAGRIVLDLKSKVEKEWMGEQKAVLAPEDTDVITALTGLGYSLREATEAAASIGDGENMSLEEKVMRALQKLSTV